ncbi:MAG TPA: hypothetical protein PLE45_08055 [Spirochaetota bacterium]|nr:hypothetical protein [Spirochaetota bacterium]
MKRNKRFEVQYNFDYKLIDIYQDYKNYISYIYLPPYREDSINSRTVIESTDKNDPLYAPQSRMEYNDHIKYINNAGFNILLLWQDKNNFISEKTIENYTNLGINGFIVANDENAKIIKKYDKNIITVASIVQRLSFNKLKIGDFSYYDYIVLFFPFTRGLDAIKQLSHLKDKLMPNKICYTECNGVRHWFATKESIKELNCSKLANIENCNLIDPTHLYLFDEFVAGYKLQGREYRTEHIKYNLYLYSKRKPITKKFQGKYIYKAYKEKINNVDLNVYYNKTTEDILRGKYEYND